MSNQVSLASPLALVLFVNEILGAARRPWANRFVLAEAFELVLTHHPRTDCIGTCFQSGREDLNLRPHGPEPCALAKLSYAPSDRILTARRPAVNGNGRVGGFAAGGGRLGSGWATIERDAEG